MLIDPVPEGFSGSGQGFFRAGHVSERRTYIRDPRRDLFSNSSVRGGRLRVRVQLAARDAGRNDWPPWQCAVHGPDDSSASSSVVTSTDRWQIC